MESDSPNSAATCLGLHCWNTSRNNSCDCMNDIWTICPSFCKAERCEGKLQISKSKIQRSFKSQVPKVGSSRFSLFGFCNSRPRKPEVHCTAAGPDVTIEPTPHRQLRLSG